jgi:replication initiation and membrane attachment protein
MTEQQHWKELLPVDRYFVRSNGLLHDYDRKILTMLYQPLIGPLACSLYFSLWSELEQNKFWSSGSSHHGLMSMMQSNLKTIYNERKKLEGIGLLKTLLKQDDERHFLYELQPPLSPSQFFDDGMLNIYLYNRLGKSQFMRTKQFFITEKVKENEYESVTHSFSDVFVSLHPSEMMASSDSEMKSSLEMKENEEAVERKDSPPIAIQSSNFDLDLLQAGLSDAILPRNALTKDVKELIVKLAYVYQINPIEMKSVVLSAVEQGDSINEELLRKAARDWYQFERGDGLPSLYERNQPLLHRTMENKEPTSREEQLIKQLERVTPYEFLKEISGGAEPSATDLRIVEDVMLKQKLNPGVVNVLIYYVMLKTDMKLQKSYVDKIAGHWVRKKILTVEKAMETAKAEHRQYQEWATSKNVKRGGRKPIREEKLPAWLKKDNEKGDNASEPTLQTERNVQPTIDTTDADKEMKELQERLKKYKKRT